MTSDWDRFYIGMAEYVSRKSKDPSTKTGAVIARPDFTVASVGYNGFPRRIKDDARLDNRDTKYSLIVHCEMNAILSAREPLHGYTLYTYPFCSCDRCAAHVIQAGIKRVVFPALPPELVERWGESVAKSICYFNEANIEIVQMTGNARI